MIFRDDVEFLIEEYTTRFGEVPLVVAGGTFPPRSDWAGIVRAIRCSLDADKPIGGKIVVSKKETPVRAEAA